MTVRFLTPSIDENQSNNKPLKKPKILKSSNRIIESHGTFSEFGLIGKGHQIIRQSGKINKLVSFEGGYFKESSLHGSGLRIKCKESGFDVELGRFVNGHLDGIGIKLSPHYNFIGKFYSVKPPYPPKVPKLLIQIASPNDLFSSPTENKELENWLIHNDLRTIIHHYVRTMKKVEKMIKWEKEEETRLLKLEMVEFKLTDVSSTTFPQLESIQIPSPLSNKEFLSQLQNPRNVKITQKSLSCYFKMKIRFLRCIACLNCKTKIKPIAVQSKFKIK